MFSRVLVCQSFLVCLFWPYYLGFLVGTWAGFPSCVSFLEAI